MVWFFFNQYKDEVSRRALTDIETSDIIRLYGERAREISQTKMALSAIIAAFITAGGLFVYRYFELQHIKEQPCKVAEPVLKAFKNIEKDLHYIGNHIKKEDL